MIQNVPIVMVMDENYVIPTKVAIWSLLRARKDAYKVDVYILCSESLKKKYRMDVKSLEDSCSDLTVSFLEVDLKNFEAAKTWKYFTVATFYRLAMVDRISADKCLFLDGDIIVKEDIYPMLVMNIGDNYIAGAKDGTAFHHLEQKEEYRKLLEIPDVDGYVNAGVMLCNLKKMREDKLQDVFMSLVGAGYPAMDQDILNKVCYGKIKHLPLQYNFPGYYFSERKMMEDLPILEQKCREVQDDIKILHYISRRKPWNNLRVPQSDIWWECAKEALDEECYRDIRQKAERENKAYNEAWQKIINKCEESKCVIIFGFTDVGKEVATELVKNGINNIVCFCDNSGEKQTQYYCDLEICAPINALEKYPTATWLITNQYASGEITEQLKSMGVREEEILYYKKQF